MLAPARPSRVSDLAAATAAGHLCSLMAGLVSNRHLIQAIHRPASERLNGQILRLSHITLAVAAHPCLAATATGSQITRTR